jgi:RHS repeat-associated protein
MGTTSYEYTDTNYPDKPTKITYPDGRFEAYTYNSRGNVIDKAVSKNGALTTTSINHTNYIYENDTTNKLYRLSCVLMPPTNITATLQTGSTPATETQRMKVVYEYNGKSDQVLYVSTYNEADHNVDNWIQKVYYTYYNDGSVKLTTTVKKNINGTEERQYVKTSRVIPVGTKYTDTTQPVPTTKIFAVVTKVRSKSYNGTTEIDNYVKAQCVVKDVNGNTLATYISNDADALVVDSLEFSSINVITNNYNFKQQSINTYSNKNKVLTSVDKNNRLTTFTYNSQERISNISKLPDNINLYPLSSSFWYNSNDTLNYKEETMANGEVTREDYSYDWAGNLTGRSIRFDHYNYNNVNSVALQYRYDNLGIRNKIILPNGSEITSTFNGSGTIAGINSPYGNMQFAYNQDNQLLGHFRGTAATANILHTRYIYDEVGRLTDIGNYAKGTASTPESESVNPEKKSVFNTFTYDSCGKMSGYHAEVDGLLGAAVRNVGFTYNARGQIASEKHEITVDNVVKNWAQMTYNYDEDTGINLTGITRVLPNTATVAPAGLTFDANNRITNNANYDFDEVTGNPTEYAGMIMEYDQDDRLVMAREGNYNMPIMECGYYADSKRAWKISANTDYTKTYFLYDGDQLLCEVKLAEEYYPGYTFNYGQYYVTAVNLWGADGLAGRAVKISQGTTAADIVAINPNTNIANYATTWYACDYQGNAVQQYTADGTLTASYAFDAFGNCIPQFTEETVDGVTTYTPAVTDITGPYGYNAKSGYYYDSEIGMYYCWHRYYDPANGRWLTEDPIGYEGGLNLYGYCGNQPVGSVDPSGLVIPWAAYGIVAGVGIVVTSTATEIHKANDRGKAIAGDASYLQERVDYDLTKILFKLKQYKKKHDKDKKYDEGIIVGADYMIVKAPIVKYDSKKCENNIIGFTKISLIINFKDMEKSIGDGQKIIRYSRDSNTKYHNTIDQKYIVLPYSKSIYGENYWLETNYEGTRQSDLIHEFLHYGTPESIETRYEEQYGEDDYDNGKSYVDGAACYLAYLLGLVPKGKLH